MKRVKTLIQKTTTEDMVGVFAVAYAATGNLLSLSLFFLVN